MNYFDDLQCIQVRHTISDTPSSPHVNEEYWGIGLMLGDGPVRRITTTGEDLLLEMPFIYLIRPAKTGKGSFWAPVNGIKRENCWFIIQGERAVRLIESLEVYCQKQAHIICVPDHRELAAILKKMLYLYKHNLPSHAYKLSLCVEEFASALYDTLGQKIKKSPIQHLAEQTVYEIIREPGKDFDFAVIAAEHHVSYDHFRRIFRQYAGQPLHEFLLEKRLFLGSELLQQSTLSIKEISEKCGFPRQAEFARFIKQRTGSSPSELRKLPEIDLA